MVLPNTCILYRSVPKNIENVQSVLWFSGYRWQQMVYYELLLHHYPLTLIGLYSRVPTVLSVRLLCSCAKVHWTTGIHWVFVVARLFHFEFLKSVCQSVCVKKWGCVSIQGLCEWQRGSSLWPVFLSFAVGRTIYADRERGGRGVWRIRDEGLLARTETSSFFQWQREVTGRQRTGDRRTASQRHLHSFGTAAYPCTKVRLLETPTFYTLTVGITHA